MGSINGYLVEVFVNLIKTVVHLIEMIVNLTQVVINLTQVSIDCLEGVGKTPRSTGMYSSVESNNLEVNKGTKISKNKIKTYMPLP
jgi:hypothetical protein